MRIRTLALAPAAVFTALLAIPLFAQGRPSATARPAAFAKCAACHSVVKGGPNGIGPNLHGVVGRKAGGLANYAYSASLKKSGVNWNQQTLNGYIVNTDVIAPGGKMPNVVTTPAERQAIIAYLAGLK